MDIAKKLAAELNIREKQVADTIALIDEGNTIPFIARYRKEVTGGLSDEVLRDLDERLTYLRNLEERKAEAYQAREIASSRSRASSPTSFAKKSRRRKSSRESRTSTSRSSRRRPPARQRRRSADSSRSRKFSGRKSLKRAT